MAARENNLNENTLNKISSKNTSKENTSNKNNIKIISSDNSSNIPASSSSSSSSNNPSNISLNNPLFITLNNESISDDLKLYLNDAFRIDDDISDDDSDKSSSKSTQALESDNDVEEKDNCFNVTEWEDISMLEDKKEGIKLNTNEGNNSIFVECDDDVPILKERVHVNITDDVPKIDKCNVNAINRIDDDGKDVKIVSICTNNEKETSNIPENNTQGIISKKTQIKNINIKERSKKTEKRNKKIQREKHNVEERSLNSSPEWEIDEEVEESLDESSNEEEKSDHEDERDIEEEPKTIVIDSNLHVINDVKCGKVSENLYFPTRSKNFFLEI